jgi:hypothetical protein
MAWCPPAPPPPEPGWWHELPTDLDRWVEGISAELRAERVGRLKALAREIEVRAAAALERDHREKMWRHSRNGWSGDFESWGARSEVEHRGGGRVLSVR